MSEDKWITYPCTGERPSEVPFLTDAAWTTLVKAAMVPGCESLRLAFMRDDDRVGLGWEVSAAGRRFGAPCLSLRIGDERGAAKFTSHLTSMRWQIPQALAAMKKARSES